VGLPGRVWIVGADGKAAAAPLRLGITDGNNTEVLEGPLKEKQEVIVGAGAGPAPRPAGGPRLM
jgi:multidrug efflux pump subunit AcrA (membrane-fusion protein)